MIKRFIRRVLGLESEPLRVPREKHGIARERLSPGALKVCSVLREGGFSAYVVGGAVRDLLLGIVPVDYDIATDARPEQVKPLFRRALIIGRRFRLVHVMMGPETLEVSTFRSANGDTSEKDEHGRVLRDNVYGTQEGDALRRDFTVNALYYDPATQEVTDFHGGLADLKKRVLRVIGDPATRYREDPVRMLRGSPPSSASRSKPARESRSRSSRRSWSACRRRACSTRCSSCCSPATPAPACASCARSACTRGCCRCST